MKIRGDDPQSIIDFMSVKGLDPAKKDQLNLRSPDGLRINYIISYDTETQELETGLFVLHNDGKMKPVADVDGNVVIVKGVVKGSYLAFGDKEIS